MFKKLMKNMLTMSEQIKQSQKKTEIRKMKILELNKVFFLIN